MEDEGEAIELARYILTDCPALQLAGLMTIGASLSPLLSDDGID